MDLKKVEIWQFLMSFSNAITYSNYIPLILLLNPSPILRKILIAGREVFRIFSVILAPKILDRMNTNIILKISAVFYTLSFFTIFLSFLLNQPVLLLINLIFYLFAFSGAFARNILIKKFKIQERIFIIAYFSQIFAFIFAILFENKSLLFVLFMAIIVSSLAIFIDYEKIDFGKRKQNLKKSKKTLILLALYVFLLSYGIARIKQPHKSYLYLLISFGIMSFILMIVKQLSKLKVPRILSTTVFSLIIFLISYIYPSLIIFYLLRMIVYLLIDFVQIEKELNEEMINAYSVGYSSSALALFLFS